MAGIIFSKSSNVNDSIFGKSQEPIRMFLEKRGEAFEQQSLLKDIFNMETSTNFAEKFTSMTAMDGFLPTGENGAYPIDDMQESYNKFIEHVTWKNSFSISQEMVEDAKIMDMRRQPEQFMASYHRTRERFGAFLLGNATKKATSAKFGDITFDLKAADGQAMFSKTHPSKKGKGTQTNLFTNAFSNVALGKMESAMQDFRGDNGELLDVCPDTIIIPNNYALKEAVFEAVGSSKDPDSANNATNYNFGRWNVIIWPYLNEFVDSSALPWILMDSRYNQTYKSAVWLDRIKLAVRSDIDGQTDANIWKGRARFNGGFVDWRGFAVGNVSGGTDL